MRLPPPLRNAVAASCPSPLPLSRRRPPPSPLPFPSRTAARLLPLSPSISRRRPPPPLSTAAAASFPSPGAALLRPSAPLPPSRSPPPPPCIPLLLLRRLLPPTTKSVRLLPSDISAAPPPPPPAADASAGMGRVLGRPMEDVRATYTFGRELGRGQFGVTYLATHKATGRRYACKSIAARKLAHKDDVEDVRREVQIMHHLTGHRNIVELRGAYEDRHSVNLVMELCEGGERTYRLALRLQRRLIPPPNHPRIRDFVYRSHRLLPGR